MTDRMAQCGFTRNLPCVRPCVQLASNFTLTTEEHGNLGITMPLAHKIKGRELLDEVSRPRKIENGAMREVRPLSVPLIDRFP